jgi:hypothetical protein
VILRIILRNRPADCRGLGAFVTSDGMGGAAPSADGRGQVVAGPGYGYGSDGSVMASSLGIAEMGPPRRLGSAPAIPRPARRWQLSGRRCRARILARQLRSDTGIVSLDAA